MLHRLYHDCVSVLSGRGMNAAFAIGRLCDMEASRNRLLKMPECDKMVNTRLSVRARVYGNWVLGPVVCKNGVARKIESTHARMQTMWIIRMRMCVHSL